MTRGSLENRWQRIRAQLPLLLPSCCALCGCRADRVLCAACHAQFFTTPLLRCQRCALALTTPGSKVCGACLQTPPAFDATVVVIDYAPPIDQLVLALKFGHRLALAPCFAEMLGARLLQTQAGATEPEPLPTLLLPVPLGPQRLAQRGFNQALEIARPLARRLGIPLAPGLLMREHDTRAQSQLHPRERQQNVHHAFSVDGADQARIRGQHIGLVDDVMTTGSTLGALAALLKRYGAARVTNLVFARTPQH